MVMKISDKWNLSKNQCKVRMQTFENLALKITLRDFPGAPVVKTPSFHYRGHGFNPWSGNYDPTCHIV